MISEPVHHYICTADVIVHIGSRQPVEQSGPMATFKDEVAREQCPPCCVVDDDAAFGVAWNVDDLERIGNIQDLLNV